MITDIKEFIDRSIKSIRKQAVGKTIVALSGGVDSSVCSELAYMAIGSDNLYLLFIDTGFMRKNEVNKIIEIFHSKGLNVINAENRFFNSIKGIIDPEIKRKKIGETFIQIFEEEAHKIGALFFIQGTIYSDVIESKEGIKSHHNVGGLPQKIKFQKVIEPLYYLFKSDVISIAKELKLHESIYNRMPFPGPGLSIRIIGEVTREKVEIVREANYIVENELLKYNPWQAFAALIGKGTGIRNNKRVYGWIISIRSIKTKDAMTAEPLNLLWEDLQRIQKRITSEIPEVVRVVYDITTKPTATIEYE